MEEERIAKAAAEEAARRLEEERKATAAAVRAIAIEYLFCVENLQQSTIKPAFRYHYTPISLNLSNHFLTANKGPREPFLPPAHFSYVCFHF